MSVPAAVHALALDRDYLSLKQYLIESTGLAYYADKDADLASRIRARLSALSLDSCGAYLALLKNRTAGESERHLLIGQLTIGETYFFRHTEQLDALRDVVFPDVIERNQARRSLRIWSAGCATGAEPYTIAMMLHEHFGQRLAGWDVQILGTDLNQQFLARAARGEFDERALRSTPDAVRRQWFTRDGASWKVNPVLAEWVTFRYHNLVEHPYPSIVHGIAALDVILCRNVMIYFDWPVVERILDRFHECLVDDGWLAVGHAESNTQAFRAYRTVSVPGATLYRKGDRQVEHRPPVVTAWQAAVPQPWSPMELPPWAPPLPTPAAHQPAPARGGPALVRQLADEGKWDEAARACEALLERDRLQPSVHFYQALIMEQLHRDVDVEQALRRALYLDRTFVLAHYHLALLLGKAGRRDEAVRSLRNVRDLLAGQRDQLIADADGLSVDDLRQLTDMHLDLLLK